MITSFSGILIVQYFVHKIKCLVGISNINKALGTSYTIEAVERDLINAVNDAADFGETNNKSQNKLKDI